ncbi:MAG: IPT/TIG domain-containing protein [Bacteroidales bacterium]
MRIFYFFLSICFLLAACEDAVVSPEKFPYVTTDEVSQVDTGGAAFSASVLMSPGFAVEDFGFTWTSEDNSTYLQSLLGLDNPENFSIRIHNDIRSDIAYTCRAYVKGEGLTLLGNSVVFIGKGSRSPEVFSVSPLQGASRSLVKVKGACLSRSKTDNLITINGAACTVTYASSDSIIFRIPLMGPGKTQLIITHKYQPSFRYTTPFEVTTSSQ